MNECRRCSECQGQSHHWNTEIRTDDGLRMQCKHCESTAEECDDCMGSGEGDVNDERCAGCDGAGVVDVQP